VCVSVDCAHIEADVCVCLLIVRISMQMCVCEVCVFVCVVSSIHGDLSQSEREVILKEFRTGSSRVLITTDLLARGACVCVCVYSVCVSLDVCS